MNKRVGDVEEFFFVRLSPGEGSRLSVTIAVPGWLPPPIKNDENKLEINEEDDDEDLKIFYADFENFFFLKNFFIRWGKFSEPKVFEILATFATVQTNFLSK